MSHLDNSERTIEVRLTSVGRKRMAEGKGVDITQFALSDDEIDYGLWQENTEQNNISDEERDALIENLPVFEAFTDETQSMRHKLVTLEAGSDQVPRISAPKTLRLENSPLELSPKTSIGKNTVPLDQLSGYTVLVEDATYLSVISTKDPERTDATIPALYKQNVNITGDTMAAVGTEFEIRRTISNIQNDQETTVTVVGNETGLSFEITVNIIAV